MESNKRTVNGPIRQPVFFSPFHSLYPLHVLCSSYTIIVYSMAMKIAPFPFVLPVGCQRVSHGFSCRIRMSAFILFFTLLVFSAAVAFSSPPKTIEDIPAESLDRSELGKQDLAILDNSNFRWSHLQTEHFVVHYERKAFALRVARFGEQFYDYISADLSSMRDRLSPKRSHVFVFRDPRDWKMVVANRPGMEPWACSFVGGNVMYLQELGDDHADKMNLLAHEMSHLVFNRFLPVALPLWLNEGLAEYYHEFAYRAARGLGLGQRRAFPSIREWTPLETLVRAADYPSSPTDVRKFYLSSKYLVGYLLLRQPREKWDSFFANILAGANSESALFECFGWKDFKSLEKDFSRFAR